MTVSYMRDAANADAMTFIKLLFRWKGSVWKAVHPELFTWLFCFILISGTYRFVLRGTDAGVKFESIVESTSGYLNRVSSSLNFVLGFYVSYVATRWWWTFLQLPWPDNFFGQLSGFFQSRGPKFKERERQIRTSINRYWSAAFIMVLREISETTRRRFPTLEHLIPSVLTREELKAIQRINDSEPELTRTCLYWIPVDWIMKLLKNSVECGNLSDLHYTVLVEDVARLRQVSLWFLEMILFDDDDYEIDFLVQRNYEHGNLVLDRIYEHIPESVTVQLKKLPTTNANVERMIGSTAKVKLTEEDAVVIPDHMQDFPKFTKNAAPRAVAEDNSKTHSQGGVVENLTESFHPKLINPPAEAPLLQRVHSIKAEQKEKQKKDNPPSKMPPLSKMTERMDVSDKTQLNVPTVQQNLGTQLDDTQRSQSIFQKNRNT